MQKITYIRWSLIVGVNAIISILFASDLLVTVEAWLGLLLGLVTFIILFANLDLYLQRKSLITWRKSLYIGVLIKALFQIVPVIELIAGSISLDLTSFLLQISMDLLADRTFFSIYITTCINGIILSLAASLIILLVRFIYSHSASKIIEGKSYHA